LFDAEIFTPDEDGKFFGFKDVRASSHLLEKEVQEETSLLNEIAVFVTERLFLWDWWDV
jgi:hypothetical protein